jgi:hypothetical protein
MRLPGELVRLLARAHAPWTRFVFILAPMRSGTTLLNHVLAEAPGILTAGETHLTYAAPQDLVRLVRKVYRYQRHAALRPSTIVEKCVMNGLVRDPALLADPRCRTVFMLRDPIATVASLLAQKGKDWPYADDPADAVGYFEARLVELRAQAERLAPTGRTFFLPYEALTSTPRPALDALGRFLGTTAPLREDYGTQRWTGVPARGDLSDTIRSGRIAARPARDAPELAARLRARAVAAHEETGRLLDRLCHTVDGRGL